MIQTLIDDKRERSVFNDHKEGSQTKFKNGFTKEGSYDSSHQIGAVNFKTDMGVLFDDVNDLDYDNMKTKCNSNDKGLKFSALVQTLGHKLGHAYGYTVNAIEHKNRQNVESSMNDSPYFRNAEEKELMKYRKKLI